MLRLTVVFLVAISVLNGVSSKRYYVETIERVSWQKALMRCASHGRQLATVNSEDEQRDLEDAVRVSSRPNGWMWLSGTSLASQGNKWMWMSTGVEVDYTNWGNFQPDFRQEQCMHIWPGAGRKVWNNWHCNQKIFYICEDITCACSSDDNNPGPPSFYLQYPDNIDLINGAI